MNLFRACNQIKSFLVDYSQNIFNGKNVDHKIPLKLFGND